MSNMSNLDIRENIAPAPDNRPLSVLLRIARAYLYTDGDTPDFEPNSTKVGYTCIAATLAYEAEEMTMPECDQLQSEIMLAIARWTPDYRREDSPFETLAQCISYCDGRWPERHWSVYDPAYWPVRDIWLNELAAYFEEHEEQVCTNPEHQSQHQS